MLLASCSAASATILAGLLGVRTDFRGDACCLCTVAGGGVWIIEPVLSLSPTFDVWSLIGKTLDRAETAVSKRARSEGETLSGALSCRERVALKASTCNSIVCNRASVSDTDASRIGGSIPLLLLVSGVADPAAAASFRIAFLLAPSSLKKFSPTFTDSAERIPSWSVGSGTSAKYFFRLTDVMPV